MKKRLTEIDLYKSYPYRTKPENSNFVTEKEFKEIMELFSVLAVNYLIYTGKSLPLPANLGDLRIVKRKMPDNNKTVDFKLTKELGKTIFHTNSHSNGYYGYIKWEKGKHKFKNATLYKFVAVRNFTRKLGKAIKKENTILKYLA